VFPFFRADRKWLATVKADGELDPRRIPRKPFAHLSRSEPDWGMTFACFTNS